MGGMTEEGFEIVKECCAVSTTKAPLAAATPTAPADRNGAI